MQEFVSYCTRKLQTIRPSATFLTVHKYKNNFNEVSDFSICFHINYLNAVRRARDLLKAFEPGMFDVVGQPYTLEELKQAKSELLQSHTWTLEGFNPLAKSAHAYDTVSLNDKQIPGIKLHLNQDILHLWGFFLHKRIIARGAYPRDTRQPLTIAKAHLRAKTPLTRFRQFKLDRYRFEKMVVENITIKEKEIIRLAHGNLSKKELEFV